jgi:hypothetical protein
MTLGGSSGIYGDDARGAHPSTTGQHRSCIDVCGWPPMISPRAALALAGVFCWGSSWSVPARAADPAKVEWSEDWRPVRPWEVGAAASLTVGDTLFETYVPLPTHASWNSGILFDDWARGVFRGKTASVQSTASTLSDIFYKGGAFVPFVMDDWFAAAGLHQNGELATRLLVIDFESLGFAGLVSLAAEHSVGRARPYTRSCGPDGHVRDSTGDIIQTCGGDNDYRSFFSGHSTATSTVASLVCLHHQHLPLFGGGFADLLPCLAMIGVAGAEGILRLVYDEHWASDVIIGWMDGVFSGYVLPSLLHFGFRSGRPLGEMRAGSLDAFPTLRPYPGGAGVGLLGTF